MQNKDKNLLAFLLSLELVDYSLVGLSCLFHVILSGLYVPEAEGIHLA